MKLSTKQKENIFQSLKGIRMEMNEGTIRSGKTMSDAQKMALIYAGHPDTNHLVLAYNQEQAYRMFMDCEGFGLEHIFASCAEIRHDEHGDHLWINLPEGEKRIYYKGGGKVNAVGAITGMSFGTVTFLEFNLLNKAVIEEAFRRTKASSFRYHLAEQNPPAPNHPNLETLKPFIETGSFKFRHWRPHDNPILTKQALKEWEAECRVSDYLYKRDWKGDRVMPEGVIYSMFNEDVHLTKEIKGEVKEVYFSADGGQGDATTCSLNVVTWKDGKYYLYRVANYYHSGKETGVIKAMSTYAKEIKQFVEWCYNEWKWLRMYSRFFVDPACKSLSEELRLLGIIPSNADNNSSDKVTSNGTKIEVGIERVQSVLSKGRFFLYDHDGKYGHYNFIKEIGMYVRNDSGYPVDKFNHALDECRYAVNYFVKRYVLRG